MTKTRRSIGAQRNPESQKAILRAARELIAEAGLAGFSVEAVARRAQAGKPTVYRWWPNRTLLLLDVYGGLKLELDDVDTGTLEGDIEAFLSGLMRFWSKGAGDVFRSVVAEAQSDPAALEAVGAFHAERQAGTAAMLGRERSGEATLSAEQARRLGALTFSYAFTRLLLGGPKVPDDELRRTAKMLAAGAYAAAS